MPFIFEFSEVCCFYVGGYFQIFCYFVFLIFVIRLRAKIKAEREAEALLSSGPGEPTQHPLQAAQR